MKRFLIPLAVWMGAAILCSCGSGSTAGVQNTEGPATSVAQGDDREQEAVLPVEAPEDTGEGDAEISDAETLSQQEGFEAPRDADSAIRAFVEAAKSADMEAVTQLFSIAEPVERYNSDSEDAEHIPRPKILDRQMEVNNLVLGFYRWLGISRDDLEDDEKLMEMIEGLTLQDVLPKKGDYDTLEIVRIDLPEADAELHGSRIGRETMDMTLYGAEGWDYRTALLSCNGETYYCGFSFVVYDGAYMIKDLSCPVLSLPWQITAFPVTEEEYESLLE